ncbi:Cell division protein FtsA [Carboxydocella sp. JDF658]|nr:Cell division protein FtsA [Carboxydocella sp. JDF658]
MGVYGKGCESVAEEKYQVVLDIGTRTLIGLILKQEEKGLKVVTCQRWEHPDRAMLDGQIHDIPAVAAAVKHVVGQLAKKARRPIRSVAVAAAGRSLRTERVRLEKDWDWGKPVQAGDISELEEEALQQARSNVTRTRLDWHYQCVGYSIVHYYLSGQPIANLVGQRGNRIGVELIATFLPREVVDSLQAVLDMTGLSMDSLTLEPIAAARVVIPPAMRQLSLALVDIGAGTADIAVTQQGAIQGYGMVPEAGDEITEALAQLLLLDFNEAERLKRWLNQKDKLEYTDILGQKHHAESSEIIKLLEPRVRELAQKIGQQILAIAPKGVQAVLLVGGGALTPGLAPLLADELGLSSNRVGIKGKDALQQWVNKWPKDFDGPDMITPLGIGLTALAGESLKRFRCSVNGQDIDVFGWQSPQVLEVLREAGVPLREILGKPGMALSFTLNGQLRLVKGEAGQPGQIWLNGQLVDYSARVRPGDRIDYSPGQPGADARVRVKEIWEGEVYSRFWFNGQEVRWPWTVKINGQTVAWDSFIPDLATVEIGLDLTVAQFLQGQQIEIGKGEIYLNKQPAGLEAKIRPGDWIEYEVRRETIIVDLEGQAREIEWQEGMLVVHALDLVGFVPKPPWPGAKAILLVNDKISQFSQALQPGDLVKLYWQKEE